ncbi:uncharacterized protein JCM6883_006797, partial [Sporobolomyces salmoneus]|uniref:uncharacterized protein n=1 Tax=Sporobolomyces salmoneus TaxID=183962 RepID=UPI00317C58D1
MVRGSSKNVNRRARRVARDNVVRFDEPPVSNYPNLSNLSKSLPSSSKSGDNGDGEIGMNIDSVGLGGSGSSGGLRRSSRKPVALQEAHPSDEPSESDGDEDDDEVEKPVTRRRAKSRGRREPEVESQSEKEKGEGRGRGGAGGKKQKLAGGKVKKSEAGTRLSKHTLSDEAEEEKDTSRARFEREVVSQIGELEDLVFPEGAEDDDKALSAVQRNKFFIRASELNESFNSSLDVPSITQCSCPVARILASYPTSPKSSNTSTSPASASSSSSSTPSSTVQPTFIINLLDGIGEKYDEDILHSAKEQLHVLSHDSSEGVEGRRITVSIWNLLVETLKEDLKDLPKKLLNDVLSLLVEPRGSHLDGLGENGYYPPTGSKKKSCFTLNKLQAKHPNDECFFSDLLNLEFPIPYGETGAKSPYLSLPQLEKYPRALAILNQRLVDLQLSFTIFRLKRGSLTICAGVQSGELAEEAVSIVRRLYGLSSAKIDSIVSVPEFKNRHGSYSAGVTTVSSVVVFNPDGSFRSVLPLPYHWCAGAVATKFTGRNYLTYCKMVALEGVEEGYEWMRTGGVSLGVSGVFAKTAAPRPSSKKAPRGLDKVIEMKKLRGEEKLTGVVPKFGDMAPWVSYEIQTMVDAHFPHLELEDDTQGIGDETLLGVYARLKAEKAGQTKMSTEDEFEGTNMSQSRAAGFRGARTKMSTEDEFEGTNMSQSRAAGFRGART